MPSTTYHLFRWGTHYLLGVNEIDHQHEQLGTLLNHLNDSYRNSAPQEELVEKLDALIAAVAAHFTTEEGFMIRHQYPETDRHKAQHDFLTRQVMEFRAELQAGRTGFSDSIMAFLKDWLRDHMLGADKRLGDYLRPRMR